MSVDAILLVAVGLAMDAFAVSLGIGTSRPAPTPGSIFRLSFHFGLFQFFMPVLGWWAGTSFVSLVGSFDHWLALGLLSFVGGRMIYSGLDPSRAAYARDPSRGRMLVMLSLATSIDALVVGLSLAMLQVDILYPSLVIGAVTASLSLIGLLVGHQLGQAFGKRMELVGGLILIGIGLRVVISHLTAG